MKISSWLSGSGVDNVSMDLSSGETWKAENGLSV